MDGRQIRAGYATIASAYAAELLGELAGKPLDRAFLDAFAETVTGDMFALPYARGPTCRGHRQRPRVDTPSSLEQHRLRRPRRERR